MVFTRNQLLTGSYPTGTIRYRAQGQRNSCHRRSQQESPPLYNAACHPVKFSVLSSGNDLPCDLAGKLSSIACPPPSLHRFAIHSFPFVSLAAVSSSGNSGGHSARLCFSLTPPPSNMVLRPAHSRQVNEQHKSHAE